MIERPLIDNSIVTIVHTILLVGLLWFLVDRYIFQWLKYKFNRPGATYHEFSLLSGLEDLPEDDQELIDDRLDRIILERDAARK